MRPLLAVGFVPAYVLARYRFLGRRALLAIVTVPFMLPTVVVGAAFLALLPNSWHGTVRAIVIAHVFFNVAVVVRLVGAMWALIPTDLTAAARTLGASPAQVLRHVVLPLLRPSLWAASYMSLGIDCKPARKVMVQNGVPDQTTAAITDQRARS